MVSTRAAVVWIAAGLAWVGGVVVGLAALMNYDNAPGLAASAPAVWPADSTIRRDLEGPTLLMLAHPRCDCTRASVAELAELMARAPHRPRAYVVFIKPGRVAGGWEQTGLWRQAEGIPGVDVVRDDRGFEARRFGVQTSGQVLLYGADGRLIYSGGTTGSRGKTGANAGRDAILAALADPNTHGAAPVFGCPLFAPEDLEHESSSHGHDLRAR